MKSVLLFSACLLGIHLAIAQRTIEGVTLDTLGRPLEKASVQVMDSRQTLTADNKGRFRFNTSQPEGNIQISHLGYYSQSIAFNDTTRFLRILLLQDTRILEEVMVNTGYQSIPKERATGSFAQIDNTKFNNRVTTDVLERLDGIVPGLQFDNRSAPSLRLNIRGINTLASARTQPLIVVDNFPFEGDISNINPNDVESVTLLKDAAATSIWGARAGNGVIVINMKKALTEHPVQLSVTANTTIGEKPDLYYYPRMNASDFIDVEMMLYESHVYDSQLNGNLANRYVFSPVIDLLHQRDRGLISDVNAKATIDSYRNLDYRDDMMRYFYRTSVNQQYNFNLSGGSRNHAYRLSAGYDHNSGTSVRSDRERITLRATNTFRPVSRLGIQTVIAYVQANTANSAGTATSYPISPGGGKTNLYPYAKLVGDDGSALAIPYLYNYNFVDTTGNGKLLDWKLRPYEEIGLAQITSKTHHVTANLNLSYDILPGLKIEGMYAFEKQLGTMQTLYGEQSFYARNQINRFTQIQGESVTHVVPLGGIVSRSNTDMESHRGRMQVNLDKTFNGKHGITVFAGSEILHRPDRSAGFRAYGYDERLLTTQPVDYVNTYPIYAGLAGNSRIEWSGGMNSAVRRFVSFYANGAYNHDGRYILSPSARRDASNLFGVATNDRWNPLWSSGVAWVASKEQFLRNVSWLDMLKFRATYGHSGNSGGSASTLPIIYYVSPSSSWRTSLSRAMVSTLPNPHLKWEDVRMINYAVDFSLLKGRISGSLEYYTKKSTDLITDDALDPTTGFTSISRNVGEVQGRGFDLQINSKNIDGAFKWNTTLILSNSRSWVAEYEGDPRSALTYTAYTGTSLMPTLDRQLYPVFSYRFTGLDHETGNPLGLLDNQVSDAYSQLLADSLSNLVYHGTALPPYYGSLQSSFHWKRFELFLNITYKFGHYFQRETINYYTLFNGWETHSDFEKRWQQPGDEQFTTVPSMIYPANSARDNFYAYSEANIEKGDLIRLQDVRLTYTFTPKLSGKTLPLRINFNMNNVGLLWKANKSGLDPDYYELPAARTYTIGLSTTF